jgi:NADPH2:quinone reductase
MLQAIRVSEDDDAPLRPAKVPMHHFDPCVPLSIQAAVVHETGPASALKIESAWPVPQIADGQVLVKNEFAGINFIDTYHRSGLYKRDLPFVGGQEGGGKIAAVTPKVGL